MRSRKRRANKRGILAFSVSIPVLIAVTAFCVHWVIHSPGTGAVRTLPVTGVASGSNGQPLVNPTPNDQNMQ
jgi:hypothetical protein